MFAYEELQQKYVNFERKISYRFMPIKILRFGAFLILTLYASLSWAQKPLNAPIDRGPKSKIELISADSLIGISGENTLRTFYGKVRFLHRGVYLNCREAIHNSGSNNLVAYGNILINQGDTLTITGDTLYYDGNSRQAKILGKRVVLKDDDMTLESRQMNYDINTDMTYYPLPGIIHQDSVVLTSDKGYYNTSTKLFNYLGNVEILHPDFVLCTDTLDYDSNTKKAIFDSFTTIKSEDGTLSANKGYYFTDSKLSKFYGRSFMENEEYTLSADTLDFNLKINEGFGVGNVEFYSKKDSLFLNGDYGEKRAEEGFTKIIGHTLLRSISQQDTLFLSSDYIIAYNSISSVKKQNKDSAFPDSSHSVSDSLALTELPTPKPDKDPNDSTKNKIEFIIADGNVKIFRNDFQSVCDSLNYDLIDSTITFIGNPMIWSVDNQMEGDTIEAWMVQNKIRKMFLKQNSFIISQDSTLNFNQIKGRQVVAQFDSLTQIKEVKVDGNGESIYFALDEKNKIIGLNRVECSSMRLNFLDRKVKKIAFLGKPESKLIPPDEITEASIKLDRFDWQMDSKPTKYQVINGRFGDQKAIEQRP